MNNERHSYHSKKSNGFRSSVSGTQEKGKYIFPIVPQWTFHSGEQKEINKFIQGHMVESIRV